MAGRLYTLSHYSEEWAGQLLSGGNQDDVLVSAPDMAPFLSQVSPFIKIHFSKFVAPGTVWRMQDKAAELILQGMTNNENRRDGGGPEV